MCQTKNITTMKTIRLTGGTIKSFILTALLCLTTAMYMQAGINETFYILYDYHFYIAGKKLVLCSDGESGHYDNINDYCNDLDLGGGTISITYKNGVWLVQLTDVTIYSSKAIYHEDNDLGDDLIIEFYGNNRIYYSTSQPVTCKKNTTFKVMSGVTTIEGTNGGAGIYIDKNTICNLETAANASLTIESYKAQAIKGKANNSSRVHFYGGTFFLRGAKGDLVDLALVDDYCMGHADQNIDLYTTGNDQYPIVSNVQSMGDFKDIDTADYSTSGSNVYRDAAIMDPDAYFSESYKSIIDADGPVCREIVISNTYAAAVNSNFFPDSKFRSKMYDLLGEFIYRPQAEITTDLDVTGEGISSLSGIRFLPNLEYLHCAMNNLKTLDLNYNTKLKYVDCTYNSLKSIDTSSLNSLTTLLCEYNELTSLKIGNNLQYLTCPHNKLSNIQNLTNLSKLKSLRCNNNEFTSLSLSSLSQLEELICRDNPKLYKLTIWDCPKLTDFSFNGLSALKELDIKNMPLLTELSFPCTSYTDYYTGETVISSETPNLQKITVRNSGLTTLSASGYPTLTQITCQNNNSLANIYCSSDGLTNLSIQNCPANNVVCTYNSQLNQIDLSACTNVKEVDCSNNASMAQIYLPPTAKTTLEKLTCDNTKITSLALSGFTKLKQLNCANNFNLSTISLYGCSGLQILSLILASNLHSLNLSTCTSLTSMNCQYTGISSLDLSKCRLLESVWATSHQMTSLLLPQNSSTLHYVACWENNIKGEDMNALFNSLPNRTGKDAGTIVVVNTSSSSENNECYSRHVNAARQKNWNTCQYLNWSEAPYEGLSNPTGINSAPTNPDDEDAPRYNSSGQRVGKDYKGIVIINGRKVLK